MPISSETRDRLTSSVAQLVRTGRHVSTRAATRTLRAEWALTALAGWDESEARQLSELLDRLVADLESAGHPARSAVPTPR